jgi:photosystem II stability/assembly factor-like uncharacterized protein
MYHVYGGQQDNSSVNTPSRTSGPGITWKDWQDGPGGESAFVAFDNPDNPKNLYGGSYQGNIGVQNLETGFETDIMAYPVVGLGWDPSEMKYRFNWNSPIVASPQNPKVIYHGANKVLKTTDAGVTWTEISPDLTKNDKTKHVPGGAPYTIEGAGGEVYNTLAYIEASQHSDQVLWTGSDCGLVHVTTDGGANWSNVTPKGLGEVLINCIDVSPHDPATAYLVATGYKFNDFQPMIFKTTNYGKDWKKIVKGIPADNFARVVREDEKRKGLLYAGTELGMYISFDDGENWEKFQLNLPLTPINDLTFADNDLVVATSGRSFWILDDLSSIQQNGNVLNNEIKLFAPKAAYRLNGGGRFRPGSIMGQNPMSGIVFDYYLPEDMDSTVITVEIWREDVLMRSYSNQKDKNFKRYIGGPGPEELLGSQKGVNRFAWDMRKESIPGVDKVFMLGSYDGIMCPPGEYEIRLMAGGKTVVTKAQLKPDPRIAGTQADYEAQFGILARGEKMVVDIQESVNKISAAKEKLQFYNKQSDMPDTLVTLSKSIMEKIDKWESKLIQRDQKTFQDVINFPNGLNAEIADLMGRASGAIPVVTNGVKVRLADLTDQYNEVIAKRKEIIDVDFASFNSLYKAMAPPPIQIK